MRGVKIVKLNSDFFPCLVKVAIHPLVFLRWFKWLYCDWWCRLWGNYCVASCVLAPLL